MRQSYSRYMREFRRQWLARMTEDERLAYRRRQADRARERRAEMTAEQRAERNRQLRVRRAERRQRGELYRQGLRLGENDGQPFNDPPETHDCGLFDQVCQFCHAIYNRLEMTSRGVYTRCCNLGKC